MCNKSTTQKDKAELPSKCTGGLFSNSQRLPGSTPCPACQGGKNFPEGGNFLLVAYDQP